MVVGVGCFWYTPQERVHAHHSMPSVHTTPCLLCIAVYVLYALYKITFVLCTYTLYTHKHLVSTNEHSIDTDTHIYTLAFHPVNTPQVRPGLFTTVMLLLGAACTAGAGAALALGAGLLLLVTVRGGSSSPTTAATTTAPTTAVASSMEVAAGDEDGDFSSMMASESDVAEVLQDVGDGQDDGGDGQALLIQDGRATQGDVKDDSVCDNNTMQGNDGERSIIQLQQGESTAPPSPDILMETHVPHDHPAAQHLRRRVNAVNVS